MIGIIEKGNKLYNEITKNNSNSNSNESSLEKTTSIKLYKVLGINKSYTSRYIRQYNYDEESFDSIVPTSSASRIKAENEAKGMRERKRLKDSIDN